MAGQVAQVKTLRLIVHELRLAARAPIVGTPLYRYLMDMYRDHQVTEQRLCRSDSDLKYLADTWLLYLKSTRTLKELERIYFDGRERTIAEAASQVGLRLPEPNLDNPPPPIQA